MSNIVFELYDGEQMSDDDFIARCEVAMDALIVDKQQYLFPLVRVDGEPLTDGDDEQSMLEVGFHFVRNEADSNGADGDRENVDNGNGNGGGNDQAD